MRWTMEKVVEQAIELYGIQAKEAAKADDLQGVNFWLSHQRTAENVLARHREQKSAGFRRVIRATRKVR